MIWELDGQTPEIAPDAWVAPDAQLMGRVVLEAEASVWWGAILRGDTEEIRVGRGSNVQDLSVLHTDPGCPLVIGADCTIGHRAILHGCTIGDGALVGMGATILNGAKIGAGALIGAGGYGQPILTGIRLDDLGLILEGAVPAALLALVVQGLFEAIERGLVPRGLRLAARS